VGIGIAAARLDRQDRLLLARLRVAADDVLIDMDSRDA
jgi:hypothetical protein